MKQITIIAGARPNFVKIAPNWGNKGSAVRRGGISYRLVHTGQHYDWAMSGSFFEELGIPEPDNAPFYSLLKQNLEKENSSKVFHGFSEKYNIPFLDYSESKICSDTLYFKNANHLNPEGDRLFSRPR